MIEENLLLEFGAQTVVLEKNENLFNEDEQANYYYQIKTGEIKMYNLTEDGKEFMQGIFNDGKSFGEPPLLGDFKYPASAAATQPSVLFKLHKGKFINLLRAHADVHLSFTALLSNRLAFKAMIGKEVSIYPPEHRILALLNYLKKESGRQEYLVDLTRQQIAELTGLRVETVIRAIKKLEVQKILQIKNHKVII